MRTSFSTTTRRLVAVAATLGVTASLAASLAAPAGAADDAREGRSAGGLAVRAAPAATGSFVVDGASPGQESARRPAVRLSAAVRSDLRRYAAESGEDLDGLIASHEGIERFSAYTSDLEQRRPGLFTTAGIGEDGGDSWIQVTRRPDAAELARLERLGLDVRVEYGAPASSAELARLAEELIDSVGDAPGVVESAEASYDDESRRMVLSVKPAGEAPAGRVDSTVDSALRSAVPGAEGELPLPVVTREVDAEMSQEVRVRGGANLNFQGSAACTAGFTAVRKGKRGLLTARHCPNQMTYGNRRGVIATKAVQTSAKRFDLQWHRTQKSNGHQTGTRFRSSRQGSRVVRKVANAPRGSVVCHWGRTSGFSCAKVRATNRCVILSGQKTCGLDATNEYISAPGDSGGPWFLGNTARGIHAGGGGNTSLFTRIGTARGALGVRVLQK